MKRLLNQFLSTVQLALRRIWTALGVLVANETIYALLLYAEAVNVWRRDRRGRGTARSDPGWADALPA